MQSPSLLHFKIFIFLAFTNYVKQAMETDTRVTLRQCDIFATEAAATCGSAAAVCGSSATFTVPVRLRFISSLGTYTFFNIFFSVFCGSRG
jgi:hypothetical protein